MDFFDHDTFIFDCDGVLLDSNCVKGKAFHTIAKKYDHDVADKFLKFHEENGGISRFKKLELLHTEFLSNSSVDFVENDLKDFYKFMENGLEHCEVCDGVKEVIEKLKGKNIFVSSGGYEPEVKSILKLNSLDHYFNQIFGSPRNKFQHVEEISKLVDLGKVVFIGDSRTDLEVAKRFSFDFLFIQKYSHTPHLELPKNLTTLAAHSLFELLHGNAI